MEQSEIKKEVIVKEPAPAGGMQVERNKDGTFKKGVSGNPAGREKGSKNWDTIIDKVFVMIGKAKGMDPNSVEAKMIMRAVIEAMKGDFRFFQYLTDRKYGKPLNKIDLHTDSEPITNIEITFIDEIKKDETKHTGNKSVEGESESLPE